MQNFFDQFDTAPAPKGPILGPAPVPKTPDPYQVQKDAISQANEAERLRLAREAAAREEAKFSSEQVEREEKAAITRGAKAKTAESLRSNLASIRRIIKDAGDNAGWGETGASGAFMRALPISGTAGYSLAADLENLKANNAFTALIGLAEQGIKLTPISNEEVRLAAASIANLDPNTDHETFMRTLRGLEERYNKALAGLGENVDREGATRAGPTELPRASGAQADPGLGPTDVTAKGGYRMESGLRGLPDAVASMIGEGRSAREIVSFLNEQYAPYGAEVGTDLAGTIGGLVNRHKANPRAPVKSLGTGWESFSMLPSEQESSLLGRVAETTPGNIAMHAANAATAGLPAALAGDQGEAVLAASRQASPVSSLIGDVAGSTAAMMGINRLAGAAGQAGRAFTAGGGVGGDVAYGATRGYSEGGLEGAAIGALGAGAGNIAGQTVIAPAIRAGASGLGRVTGRTMPTLSGTEARAARYIPEDAAAQLDEAAAAGQPMMLADTSPQMRALAGSVSRRSPEAYEIAESALRPRSLGQGDRAIAAIEDTLGGIENPIEASESLMAAASQTARPLYDEFYAQPARSSPLLKSLMERPAAKDALNRAREIAADEGVDSTKWGIDLDSEGNLAIVRDLSPETIDYVKRALDDVIEAKGNRNAVTGKLELGESGRAVVKLKNAFVKEADRLYPQYAKARAAYAGPAAAKAALEDGRRMANSRPREIERRMRDMPEAEKEQFRLGLRIGIADKVLGKNLRSDAFEPLYGSPDAQGRIAALSPTGAEEFGKRYGRERQMAETATEVLGGSPTARRQAADQTFENRVADFGEAGFAAMTGAGAQGLAGRIAKGVSDRYRAGFTERTANELAPILFNDDPAAGAAFIRALLDRAERAEAFRRSTSRAGAGIGAALGTGAAVQ